jgi:hypothetical protein
VEHPSRFVAEQRCGTSCQNRLVEDWPKQRRFERGQTERRFEQRRSGQYAGRKRLGWQPSGHRLFALGVVVRDDRFRGTGRDRRQLDRHGGAREWSNRQKGSEPRRKPPLQHVASIRALTAWQVARLPSR